MTGGSMSLEIQVTGEATRSDVQQYVENAGNEKFWTVYYSTVSVVATKPQ